MLLLFTEQAQHLQTLPQQVAGCTLKAGLPLANNTGTVFCFVFCFIFLQHVFHKGWEMEKSLQASTETFF